MTKHVYTFTDLSPLIDNCRKLVGRIQKSRGQQRIRYIDRLLAASYDLDRVAEALRKVALEELLPPTSASASRIKPKF